MTWAVLLAQTLVLIVCFAAGFAAGWCLMDYLFGGSTVRENYGPPPGMRRALHHEELGDRGWPSWPFEYTANTASSISHMVERSA